MLIAFCSVKGSPGVTTAALALAATWPAPRRLVMEADPAGGDLATRLALPASPGLIDLAATARHSAGPDAVWQYARPLADGLYVVTAPSGGEQARACVLAVAAASGLAGLARGREPVVLADCGRMDPGTPALPLARQADLTVVLARPHLGDLAHVAQRLPDLAGAGLRLAVLLAASPRRLPSEAIYPAREVAATLNLPVIGQLPADERSVALLTGNLAALPRRRLLPLLRTAGGIAAALAASLPNEPRAAGPGPGTTRAREVAEVSGDPIR
jgi:MinD-like ATPase involved in chromosome partitioning or flagellar assembly